MSRRLGTLIIGVAVLIALGAGAALLPVPYVALGPGPTYNTLGSIDGRDIITVTGRTPNPTSGHLNLTTIGVVDGIELFRALEGWVNSQESVVPRDEVIPPDQTEQEVDAANRQDFIDSQNSAEAAALAKLGYPLKVVVVGFADSSPSESALKAGDTLDSIDGAAITEPDVLLQALAGHRPGDQVTLGYTRDGAAATTTVVTTTAAKGNGAALGIQISYERKAPFQIDIQVANVGGPSAGLMLALGVLDMVGDTDLTGGKFFAGTGTITNDGVVGPIGGIRLKMIAASAAGAEAFLVPADNCAEALTDPPAGLTLAKVSTLDTALTALADLRAGTTPPSC